MVDMGRMPPRFKDIEQLLQHKEQRHWEKTRKSLIKMGIEKSRKFDRLLLEELGLVGYFSENEDSDNE